MKRKNKGSLLTVLTALLMVTTLTSCGSVSSENNSSNSSGNSSDISSDTSSTNQEGKLSIKSIQFVQNKTEYLFGESVNYSTDFSVRVTLSDNSEFIANYDKNRANGWYFTSLYNPNGETLTTLPDSFTLKGEYQFKIGISNKNEVLTFANDEQIPSGKIVVLGGYSSGKKPEKIQAVLSKKTLNVGEKFSLDYLTVQGYWKDYGGYDDIPSDKVEIISSQFDLNETLKQTGSYTLTISYMGVSTSLTFEVIKPNTISKESVNYTYYNYGDDNPFGNDAMSPKGEPKTLIVPIWFNNSSKFVYENQKDRIKNDIKTAYLGTSEETGWHSVQSYYWEDSYHQLKIQGEMADWYNVNMKAEDFSEENTEILASTVAKDYRQYLINNNRLDEFSSFDSDNDGFLDAVIMIYAAPTNYKRNDNLWAYCYWADNAPNKENPTTNVFFWASYEFMYGEQPSGSPIKIDAHTYIHEMGHILGLDDYYDYSNKSNPAGGFSMQDNNVGGHDPFSKLAYGWVAPYVPTKTSEITLGDFDSTGDLIVLCPNWDGSPFNEYLLLEYWTPTGLNELDSTYLYGNVGPKGPNHTGLRVWHVDTRLHPTDDYDIYEDYVTRKSDIAPYVLTTISNTSFTNGLDPNSDQYCSPFKEEYNLDELALLNHSKTNQSRAYNFNEAFSNNHLWDVHDKFSMNSYKMQFPNRTLLNSGIKLGFDFEVTSKTEETITVKITKN